MRLAFLIDGFNVYHSIKVALKENIVAHAKWLDYWAFCQSLSFNVSYLEQNSSSVVCIYYFSALPTHIANKNVLDRHLIYINALKSTGINVVLGNFKRKRLRCRFCKQVYIAHEEKETDINIAVIYSNCLRRIDVT